MRAQGIRRSVGIAVVPLLLMACSAGSDDTTATSMPATTETTAAIDRAAVSDAEDDPPSARDDAQATAAQSATIPSSTTPPTPTAPPTATTPERFYDFSAISPVVQEFLDERGLDGAGLIVVDAEDGVVHHEHWGEFDEDRISLVASSSKMITAGVLMRLDDDGLLDIDAPVADVAPWGAGNPDITLAQLVSNSSGLVGLLTDPGYAPYACQFRPAGTMQSCAAAIFTTPDDDADIVGPDQEFRYGGAQWQVAGAVAELASGKSWSELIDEIYVRPCGLDALGYNNHWAQFAALGFGYPSAFDSDPSTLAPTDNPNMEGGAYLTTGDYGRLLLMHLRGGRCDDNRVLSPQALERMHADRIAAAYDGDAWGPERGYGMGWWVDRDSGRISDPGAYGSVAWLDLDDGYGAFMVIEADSFTGNELAGLLYDIVDEAVTST